jgi:hypothetical protein
LYVPNVANYRHSDRRNFGEHADPDPLVQFSGTPTNWRRSRDSYDFGTQRFPGAKSPTIGIARNPISCQPAAADPDLCRDEPLTVGVIETSSTCSMKEFAFRELDGRCTDGALSTSPLTAAGAAALGTSCVVSLFELQRAGCRPSAAVGVGGPGWRAARFEPLI